MIFTTAYTSVMVRPMSDGELVDLLVRSRARNADRGVTGLLLYRKGRVMQMLEGEERVVRDLYDRIRMDVRHHEVTNVWTSVAERRQFPEWTMGFEDLDGKDRSVATGRRLIDERGRSVSAEPSANDHLAPSSDSELVDVLNRREHVLQRALVSGDRLVGALAIILHGHEPVRSTSGAGLRCRECRVLGDTPHNAYPCPTTNNALWALESVLPR